MARAVYGEFYAVVDFQNEHEEYVTEYQPGEIAWVDALPVTVSIGVMFAVEGIPADDEKHRFCVCILGPDGKKIAKTQEKKFVRTALIDDEMHPETRMRLDGRFRELGLDSAGMYTAELVLDGEVVGHQGLLIAEHRGLADWEDLYGGIYFQREAHEAYNA